jgi:ATP-dependent DNA ligase
VPGQEQIVNELLPFADAVPPIAPGTFGVPAAANSTVLAAYADPRPYFAGELYLHGKPLNWIIGQARRAVDDGQLEFRVFDVFFPYAMAAGHLMKSRDRQAYVDAFFAAMGATPHPHVLRVPNTTVHSMEELVAFSKECLKQGYEGAIARKDDGVYQYGYGNHHSDSLIKIKPKFDNEFAVVGFAQGTRGKDVGAVIWECEVPNPISKADSRFTVVPNMPLEQRKRLYTCLNEKVTGPGGKQITRFDRDLKGTPLTIEYANLSVKTGKPLQPKAIAFRTYEQGPDLDPVLKMLKECCI